MSKNSFDVFNSSKRKAKNSYTAKRKNKIKDRDMSKKDDMSFRSKIRMCSRLLGGEEKIAIKKLREICYG
mgnify:CR=1 FL=1